MTDDKRQTKNSEGDKGACPLACPLASPPARPLDGYTHPPPLVQGDQIGIFAPASPVKEPYRSNGIKRVRELGYVPVETVGIEGPASPGDFLAKSPAESFSDIQCFFKTKEIKALWAGRGGVWLQSFAFLFAAVGNPRTESGNRIL